MDVVKIASHLIAFVRVVGSSLGSKRGAVLYDVAGVGFEDDPDDAKTETRDEQETYGAIGVIGRPPKKPDGDLLLEALALRTSDGLVPIAFRDERILKWLNKREGNPPPSVPKEGQILYAGYGGAFLSFETLDASNGPTNIIVLYCPYERDSSGVPQKAHMLMLDPTSGNESIAIVHAEGVAITMTKDEGVLIRADGATTLQVKPGLIQGTAASIILKGNVTVGRAGTGVPLTPSLTSPPCPSLFLSPL